MGAWDKRRGAFTKPELITIRSWMLCAIGPVRGATLPNGRALALRKAFDFTTVRCCKGPNEQVELAPVMLLNLALEMHPLNFIVRYENHAFVLQRTTKSEKR